MTANLSADRKKLIERIAKLLALAEGTTYDAEAQTARETVLRLMAEHNIRASETREEPFQARAYKPYFYPNDVWYERRVKFAIRKHNNCLTLARGLNEDTGTIYGYTSPDTIWCLDCFERRLGRPPHESDFDATPHEIMARFAGQTGEPLPPAECQAELDDWRADIKRNPPPS